MNSQFLSLHIDIACVALARCEMAHYGYNEEAMVTGAAKLMNDLTHLSNEENA